MEIMQPEEFDSIVIPQDASKETIIDFLNDLQLNFTDKTRKAKWAKYVQKIKVKP